MLCSLPLKAGSEDISLASRYLKLTSTYLMNCRADQAAEYIKKAELILSKENASSWNVRYWKAVASEYRGYLNLCLGMQEAALKEFYEAKRRYTQLISMDGGSQDALKSIDESMKNIESNLDEDWVVPGISNQKILNLDNQKIKDNFFMIPKGVENLSLANNRIKDIYGLLDKRELTHLNLSDNRIKDIPVNISDLAKLEWLDLSDNRIKELPTSLCEMKSLKVLNLKNNRLPMEDITNLIKCLPNTNILYDEYIRKDDAEESEDLDLDF